MDLLPLARKCIWWQLPEYALKDQHRTIAQVTAQTMLVLNGHVGDAVIIADDVFVLGASGMQIRFGFDADVIVSIYREETHERSQREQA
jgi:carbon storage regulator CsrA